MMGCFLCRGKCTFFKVECNRCLIEMHPTCLFDKCERDRCPNCKKHAFPNFRETYITEHMKTSFPETLGKVYNPDYNSAVRKATATLNNWRTLLTNLRGKKKRMEEVSYLVKSTSLGNDFLQTARMRATFTSILKGFCVIKQSENFDGLHHCCPGAVFECYRTIVKAKKHDDIDDLDLWFPDSWFQAFLSYYPDEYADALQSISAVKEWLFQTLGKFKSLYEKDEEALTFKMKYAKDKVQELSETVTNLTDALDNKSKVMDEYVSKMVTTFGKDTCQICMDAKPEYANATCGHRLFCHDCIKKCDKCPMCHKQITTVIKIFT